MWANFNIADVGLLLNAETWPKFPSKMAASQMTVLSPYEQVYKTNRRPCRLATSPDAKLSYIKPSYHESLVAKG